MASTNFLNKPKIKNLDAKGVEEFREEISALFDHIYDIKDKYGDNLNIIVGVESYIDMNQGEAYTSTFIDKKDTIGMRNMKEILERAIRLTEETNRFAGIAQLDDFRVVCVGDKETNLKAGKKYKVKKVKLSDTEGVMYFRVEDLDGNRIIGKNKLQAVMGYDSQRFCPDFEYYEKGN